MTLDRGSRDAIARTVAQLRALFEAEFSQLASGRFGLHAERRADVEERAPKNHVTPEEEREGELRPWVEPLDALSLTPGQVIQREELVGAVGYLHHEGLDGGQAVARLVREAAFTAVNRLLAVRVAEAIGVLPEATSSGRQSRGYRDVVRDLFPLLAKDADEGFWLYLQVCGDELGATVPLLFDRRLPTSAFVPSRVCVDNALELINDEAVADVWGEPEALGWAYQFFNTEDERQQMRGESTAPRDARELAVRNQFFTPRYVVDWLVQNTLGRRLREAGLEVEVPLLVGELGEATPLELSEVRVLDPAVGSGHFLLGCYDLLEEAWESVGVNAEEAAPRILQCLFGVEIDPRASQVAQTVLFLRARRSAPNAMLEPPGIVTARALPGDPTVRSEVFARLSENVRDLAMELERALAQAPLLGSLLRVEARLDTALEQALAKPKLALEVTLEELEKELRSALDEIALRAEATPGERMFAADAVDAIQFTEICRHRYDVVLMNPPFGQPIAETLEQLRATFGSSAVDIYAMFVDRGVELLNAHGYMGAITSRTGFFITRFDSWRSNVVLPRLRAMIDLGSGVMHDALVQAAAYVLAKHKYHLPASFRRLLGLTNKASATYEGLGDVFERVPEDFASIPGAPAAYWLPESLMSLFKQYPGLEGSGQVKTRRGAYTGDDFRYVRCWWEVPISGPLGQSHRWVSFVKGGEYSPYYSSVRLCVDWDETRGTFRDFHGRKGRPSPIPENRDFFGRRGLTWSARSQKGFSIRPVPAGSIFSRMGCMLFVSADDEEKLNSLMAYLNSSVTAATLETMVPFGMYEVGAVQRIPYTPTPAESSDLAQQLTTARMREAQRDETDHLFLSPWIEIESLTEHPGNLSREVDDLIARAVGESESPDPISATYPTRWFEKEYEEGTASPSDEVSYLIGAAFGRWDIRIAAGIFEAPPMPGPYDSLPPSSRGMLVGEDGLPTKPPYGYPIEVAADGILHDDPGHQRDIVAVIEAAAEALALGPVAPNEFVYQREIRELRLYLRDQFFPAHLTRYSVSRRYAPIFWQLAVPSRQWGLWIYAPALSREMLFAIASGARDKLRRVTEQSERLRNELAQSTSSALIKRAEELENLAGEIETFAEVAEVVAQSGWRPDLNDGLVLCAVPFEDLFMDRAWKSQIAKHRVKLKNGAYPWATVQQAYFRSQR